MSDKPIGIFLIDDHPVVEAGLRLGFGLFEEFRFLGMALNHDHGLDQVEELQPDVIISDLVIDGELDFSQLARYREAAPAARVVAFSSLSAEAYAGKCIEAGADGFISKSTSPHELVKALKAILDTPRSDKAAAVPPAQRQIIAVDGVHLTKREGEVAYGLAQGKSILALSEDLGIAKKTVAIHRDNLRIKLNCASSAELIALLARNLRTETA